MTQLTNLFLFLALLSCMPVLASSDTGKPNAQVLHAQARQAAALVCPICIDEIATENLVRLGCKHVFHTQCIATWIARSRTCPLCRTVIPHPQEEEEDEWNDNEAFQRVITTGLVILITFHMGLDAFYTYRLARG